MRTATVGLVAFVAACAKQGEAPPPPAIEASRSDAAAEAPSVQDASMAAPPATSAAPSATADAAPDAGAAEAPPPKVKIVTIGMHVGGGPYDEATKEPMKRSVEPHFAELAKCWRLVPKPKQADAGVDLVIEADGGKAKVSNPRATVDAEGFKPCVVAFFESIVFEKPKTGKTTVSYSVRFLP